MYRRGVPRSWSLQEILAYRVRIHDELLVFVTDTRFFINSAKWHKNSLREKPTFYVENKHNFVREY